MITSTTITPIEQARESRRRRCNTAMQATPTNEPAVPGAMGKRPTGPIVATRTATPERGSVKIFLDRLRALRSLFLLALIGKRRRDAVTAREPVIEIDHAAALTTERAKRIRPGLDFTLANGAACCHNSRQSPAGFRPVSGDPLFLSLSGDGRQSNSLRGALPGHNPMLQS